MEFGAGVIIGICLGYLIRSIMLLYELDRVMLESEEENKKP